MSTQILSRGHENVLNDLLSRTASTDFRYLLSATIDAHSRHDDQDINRPSSTLDTHTVDTLSLPKVCRVIVLS